MKQHVETSQISGTRGIEASKDKSPTIVTKEEVKEARAEAGAEAEAEEVVIKQDQIWSLRVKDRRSVSNTTGGTAWIVPRVVYYMCVTEG